MNTENTDILSQDSQTSANQTLQRDVAIDRVDYRLPDRDTRKQRGSLIVSLVGSLFGVAFMLFWMGMPLAEGIDLLKQNKQFGWALIAFGSLGFLVYYRRLVCCAGASAHCATVPIVRSR